MNVLEPMFLATFTKDTYCCIKNRGIHGASFALRSALNKGGNAQFYLQFDIQKFYPNVDHSVLKLLLRRKIKDNDLLILLDEIIDSAPGLPIGNYLSQYFANFYLSYLDHYIKEVLMAKHYFRYSDDSVLLSDSKPELHKMFHQIRDYLKINLNLDIKKNYCIRPVSCGIDFVGYVHYPDHVMMRKSIKKRFAKVAKRGDRKSIASYYGWAKHSNSKNLLKKLLMKNFKDLNIEASSASLTGEKIKIDRVLNKPIVVHGYQLKDSKFEKGNGKCLHIQIEMNGEKRVVFTGSGVLMETIQKVPVDSFPFSATIVKDNDRFLFT